MSIEQSSNLSHVKDPVVIVGGGWSGLAVACYLAAQDIPVTVIESAKQLGGRARKSSSRTQTMDNGQHLMLGAYREMLDLMAMLEIDEATAFRRLRQQLKLIDGDNGEVMIDMKLPKLPKPLNLATGLMTASGIGLKDKILVAKNFDKLLKQPLTVATDITVSRWLNRVELPDNYRTLLESLCLAALNTPAEEASALSFQNVLNETFNGAPGSTDLMIPAQNLGQVFPAPAKAYLATRQGQVIFPEKINLLNLDDSGRVSDIRSDKKTYRTTAVVLATPSHISQQLMNTIPACDALCKQIAGFDYAPITTVYLKYTEDCQIAETMIGLENMLSEWIFDRRVCDQPGLIAVVISSHGPHMDMENRDLSLAIIEELATIFPDWPRPGASWVIREKRATFSCTPQSHQHRPGVTTPVPNLFLSGDYLDTDSLYLPATLETAIRNAKVCAQEVVNYLATGA